MSPGWGSKIPGIGPIGKEANFVFLLPGMVFFFGRSKSHQKPLDATSGVSYSCRISIRRFGASLAGLRNSNFFVGISGVGDVSKRAIYGIFSRSGFAIEGQVDATVFHREQRIVAAGLEQPVL